jgi:hypothetical protein
MITQPGTENFDGVLAPFRFTLKEIISRIPDLTGLNYVTFGLGASHPTYIQNYQDLQRDFYISPVGEKIPNPTDIRRDFNIHPEFDIHEHDYYYPVGRIQGLEFKIHRENSPAGMHFNLIPVKNDGRGIPYMVEPLAHGIRLSSLSLLFLVSYALGMIVRYHPSHWAVLAGTGPGDSIRPLLNTAAQTVERRFPELVLDEIEQTHPRAVVYHDPSNY